MSYLSKLDSINHAVQPEDFGYAGNIGKNKNDYCEYINTWGHSTITFSLVPPVISGITNGYVSFEASFDGSTWEEITIRNMTTDTLEHSTNEIGNFIGSIAGVRKFRLVNKQNCETPGTAFGRAQEEVAVIETIEFNAPPHKFGYSPIKKILSATNTLTDEIIWTPTSGKRFVITGMSVIVGGANNGVASIYEDSNTNGNKFFTGNIIVENKGSFVWNYPSITAIPALNIDTSLKISTTNNLAIDVMVYGYEI